MYDIIFHFILGLGNFEPKEDEHREGPGEGGVAYDLSNDQSADSEIEYGMNMYVSDRISLNRSVKDTRMKECKHWDYPEELPSASVVIVFHNEGMETFCRYNSLKIFF